MVNETTLGLRLISQEPTKKVWLLNGQRVIVWNDHSHCLKCGRPLKSEFSRLIGRGHSCRVNPYSVRHAMMVVFVIKIKESV